MRYTPLMPFLAHREGRWLVMDAPFECEYTYRGRTRTRRLHMRFRWNGASVPPSLHWWQDPYAEWVLAASAWHDEAYHRCDIPRLEADGLFRAALYHDARRLYPVVATGGWRLRYERFRLARKLRQARIMYAAVRTFGAAFWGR
jgi:hypothetical protein